MLLLFAADAAASSAGGMSIVTEFLNNSIYGALALVAVWGLYCVLVVWRRVGRTMFRNEEEQEAFLDTLDEQLANGDFKAAEEMCDEDDRALPQLALLAVTNREAGYRKIRTLLVDRFQRDVIADLEYRLSWVFTVIKCAPMLGLLGTVMGMMGAFANLASGGQVDQTKMAEDISFALITTAIGLFTAIPLVISTAYINVRIRKLEDLIGVGMTRLVDTFKALALTSTSAGGED